MLPFKTLLLIDQKSKVPTYKQLTNKLTSLIHEGKILPGTMLPGTRPLGLELGLDRKTISRAYEELIQQDWVESIPKKGYRVRPELPTIKPRTFQPKNQFKLPDFRENENTVPDFKKSDIVINDGYADITLFPYNELLKNFKRQFHAASFKQRMSVRDMGGLQDLKTATCRFLNQTRGLYITADEIVLTRGAQMAIFIAATLLAGKGDEVAVSDPNYPFADKIFTHLGAKLVKVRTDEDGMDIDHLEELLKKGRIKLIYLVPHHHHPTTVTLTASRRLKLLELIRTYKCWLIEDDYDYDFHFKNSPILPLASSDHGGKIIYIGSFTKLLGSPYRIGYLIGATDIVRQAISLRALMDLRGDTILEQGLADMINNGELAKHIKKANKLYTKRCAYTCRMLERRLSQWINFKYPSGGMAIWIRFNPSIDLAMFIRRSAAMGLHFLSTQYTNTESMNHNGLRFGYASLSEPEIEKAISIMETCLKAGNLVQ
jgi:GntR family transcriptional regulator/MocR family aminotransferase